MGLDSSSALQIPSAGSRAGLLGVVIVFDTLFFVALFLLISIVLAAKFSPSTHRMKTWYLFLGTCILYSISFLFLVGQQSGQAPGLPVCIIQSGLIYAAPPMVAFAALLFVVELHLRLTSVIFSSERRGWIISWLAIGIPLTHFIVFWATFILGLSDLNTVERNKSGAFCHIAQTAPTLITAGISSVYMVIMLGLEIFTIYHLLRQRHIVKKIQIRGTEFPLSLFIRMFAFSVAGGIAQLIVILLNTKMPDSIDLYPFVPLAVVLVFGSQTDILRLLIFWKRPMSEDYSISASAVSKV